MDFEHTIKSFPIDANYAAEIKKIDAEGWQLVPGVSPVAVYHLMRQKPGVGTAMGSMRIDEAGVFIIPAGQKTQ